MKNFIWTVFALFALGLGIVLVRELSVVMADGTMSVLGDFKTVMRRGFVNHKGAGAAFRLILIATFVGWVINRFKKRD